MSSRDRTRKRHRRPDRAPSLVSKARRAAVARVRKRDGDDCYFCAEPLGDDVTVEHLREWAAGGSNDLANLVLAHLACNRAAKGLTVADKQFEHELAVALRGVRTGAAA